MSNWDNIDWDALHPLRQDAVLGLRRGLEGVDKERAGYDDKWQEREEARRKAIEERAAELVKSGKAKPMNMARATGVISMDEYKKRHPQRFRDQIREGCQHKKKTDPEYAVRNGVKGRAVAAANGWRPGPTPAQLKVTAMLRDKGTSWSEISRQLGLGGGNTPMRWFRKGLVKCSR